MSDDIQDDKTKGIGDTKLNKVADKNLEQKNRAFYSPKNIKDTRENVLTYILPGSTKSKVIREVTYKIPEKGTDKKGVVKRSLVGIVKTSSLKGKQLLVNRGISKETKEQLGVK